MSAGYANQELIANRACGYGMTWTLEASIDSLRDVGIPDFVFVDGNRALTADDLERIAPHIDEPPALFASIDGPVQTTIHELGLGAHAILSAHTPQHAAALTSANTGLLEGIDRLAKLPLAGIVIVDNLCGGAGALVNPMVVVGILMQLYHDAIRQARALGLPCIFRTDGDAREYYTGFKDAGFWGVSIGRCDVTTTVDLFDEARKADLVPVGGLTSHQIGQIINAPKNLSSAARTELQAHLQALAQSGKGLLCDDGTLTRSDEIYLAHQLISEAKLARHGEEIRVCELFE